MSVTLSLIAALALFDGVFSFLTTFKPRIIRIRMTRRTATRRERLKIVIK
jgi:hypothetical protein